jgi:hypothetical protein
MRMPPCHNGGEGTLEVVVPPYRHPAMRMPPCHNGGDEGWRGGSASDSAEGRGVGIAYTSGLRVYCGGGSLALPLQLDLLAPAQCTGSHCPEMSIDRDAVE